MLILALDTSTLMVSLALVERLGEEHRLIDQVDEGPPKRQSELLPALIGELLTRSGVELEALGGIAVGMGPGSFTGLRIGLSSVKALAYAKSLKVAGVSSLRAMALDGPEGVVQLPCALARRGELYFGQYRRLGDQVETLAGEDVETTAEFGARLKRLPSARALGPGLDSESAALLAVGVESAQFMTAPRHPSAFALARLVTFPEVFEVQALFALEPHYLRASEPERNPKFPPLPGPAPAARLKD